MSKWAITCATPHFTNQCELWRKASAEKNTNISLQSMREVRTNNAFQEKTKKSLLSIYDVKPSLLKKTNILKTD